MQYIESYILFTIQDLQCVDYKVSVSCSSYLKWNLTPVNLKCFNLHLDSFLRLCHLRHGSVCQVLICICIFNVNLHITWKLIWHFYKPQSKVTYIVCPVGFRCLCISDSHMASRVSIRDYERAP